MPAGTPDRPPACPRCGYDLSGAVAAWEDACPLEGVCPECGHTLRWAAIFDASRNDIPWLIEHARSKRALVARTMPTLWRMALARPYWKGVGVDSRVRVRPVIVLLSLIFVAMYLVGSGFIGHHYYTEWRPWHTTAVIAKGVAVNVVVYGVGRYGWPPFHFWEWTLSGWELVVWVCALNASWPMMLGLLPVTRKRAKLRAAHLSRASAGGMLALCPILAVLIAERVRYDLWGVRPAFALSAFAATVLWNWWWWGCALTVGWRVHRGVTVSVLLAVVSFLFATTLMATLWMVLIMAGMAY